MINYTPQNQLSLEGFTHPFERDLNPENRWVKLASLVPWDELAEVYSRKLQAESGRKTIDIRIVLADMIVKHKLRLDDRGTIDMIQENIYIQYFCGFKSFTTKKAFDPSLFVDIRKRLGAEEFSKFNQLVIEKSERIKPPQARIKKQQKEPVRDRKERNDNDGNKDNASSALPNKGTLSS